MTDTPNLSLPYITAAQAQKHVTHNEALRALDVLAQLNILDRDLSTPPASPADGDRYIVAAMANGDWTGKEDQVAAWQDNAWRLYAPRQGWLAWIADEGIILSYDGSSWVGVATGGGSVNPVPLVGVNATADTTNRLSMNSPASLFNHEGAGHQQKINKATAGDTASQLYQTGFSGRAEIGLTGDDDFHLKVSPDGVNWKDAILVVKDTAEVSFPNTTIGGSGGAAALATDVLLNALAIADLQGDRLNMVDGIADPFDDESDVDTATATGQSYSAINDRYINAGSVATSYANAGGTGDRTASITITSNASLAASPTGVDNLIDGALGDNVNDAIWFKGVNSVAGVYFRFDFGSGASKVIDEMTWKQNASDASGTWIVQGSDDASSWTDIGASFTLGSAANTIINLAGNITGYRYYQLIGVSGNNSGAPFLGEIEFKIDNAPSASNMTLPSNSFTADATPTAARLLMQIKPIDAVAVNTDIIGEVSRDDGTTWTAATLVKVGSMVDGTEYFEDQAISISAQSSGTSMKWRLRTLNTKSIELAGVLLQWS